MRRVQVNARRVEYALRSGRAAQAEQRNRDSIEAAAVMTDPFDAILVAGQAVGRLGTGRLGTARVVSVNQISCAAQVPGAVRRTREVYLMVAKLEVQPGGMEQVAEPHPRRFNRERRPIECRYEKKRCVWRKRSSAENIEGVCVEPGACP